MTFDTHSIFAYSTVQLVISQNSSTLVLNVPTSDAGLFHINQQIIICPANTFALISNAMIGRITSIAGNQFTIATSSGNREGSNFVTVSAGMQIMNGWTPKVLTDIEAVLNALPTFPASGIVGLTETQTVTNKRRTRRVVVVTQSATPAINTDNTDVASITGLAQAITSMTSSLTGTPNNGDLLEIQITDNGTPRAITWGATFASTTLTLPTTTVTSTLLRTLFEWNSTTSHWECIGTA